MHCSEHFSLLPLGNLQIETNGAHPVRPSDMFSRCNCNLHKWLETELLLLNNLLDRASEKGMYIEISFADQLYIFLFLTSYIKLIDCLLADSCQLQLLVKLKNIMAGNTW